ncbi:FeoB-associated Cys-rich membrane protein [Clostridium sp. CX1]|nr:FeoB-associated Cys-rich membrane protein [Clostridium sp. CX1]MCT8977672.1 FeoB-associated Cys-rich membrane protein [Clostridium sp. CX1]
MSVEIIITSIIVVSAAYILYKNVKKKASGDCSCGSCTSHCPRYKKD